jgi:hypothetical protein
MKPANSKVHALLAKLEALAAQGIGGEKVAAAKKLAWLKARFDFTKPDPTETPDLFAGRFRRGSIAVQIHRFESDEFDIVSGVRGQPPPSSFTPFTACLTS